MVFYSNRSAWVCIREDWRQKAKIWTIVAAETSVADKDQYTSDKLDIQDTQNGAVTIYKD